MTKDQFMDSCEHGALSRRRFLQYAAAAGLLAGMESLLPVWARQPTGLAVGPGARAPGEPIDLVLRRQDLDIGGRTGLAITPLRHYMDIILGVFLKDAELAEL